MSKITILVNRLIKEYKGGEVYFDRLDEELRKPENFDLISRLIEGIDKETPIIVTGKFGLYFKSKFIDYNIFVFSGGLRGNGIPRLEVMGEGEIRRLDCVFIDDSFYSGTTRGKIGDFLDTVFHSKIVETRVVYDGNQDVDDKLKSLYRYYN